MYQQLLTTSSSLPCCTPVTSAHTCRAVLGLRACRSILLIEGNRYSTIRRCVQEGVEAPIHVMLQPDYLTARVAALEDLEIYVEDLAFAKILCEETKAVKRVHPMKVPIQ